MSNTKTILVRLPNSNRKTIRSGPPSIKGNLDNGRVFGRAQTKRERISFKEYKNLNDLVKATKKCAVVLNEAKLEKRNVEFVNSISVNDILHHHIAC